MALGTHRAEYHRLYLRPLRCDGSSGLQPRSKPTPHSCSYEASGTQMLRGITNNTSAQETHFDQCGHAKLRIVTSMILTRFSKLCLLLDICKLIGTYLACTDSHVVISSMLAARLLWISIYGLDMQNMDITKSGFIVPAATKLVEFMNCTISREEGLPKDETCCKGSNIYHSVDRGNCHGARCDSRTSALMHHSNGLFGLCCRTWNAYMPILAQR